MCAAASTSRARTIAPRAGDAAADGRGGARHHVAPQLATRGPFGSGQGLTVKAFARPVPSRSVGAVWRKSTARNVKAVCDVIHSSMVS